MKTIMRLDELKNYRLGLFLVISMLLGGTSQNIVAPKLLIYLLSLMLIGWSLSALSRTSRIWKMKIPLIFFCVLVGLYTIYLIPVPATIWTNFPARSVIENGYELMSMDLPKLPASMNPQTSFFSMFDLLPILAVLLVVGTLASRRELKIAIMCIVFFSIVSVILGFLQSSGIDELYFYKLTDKGAPVGFFSNPNHQASFLLMVIPFAIGLATLPRKARMSKLTIALAVVAFIFALLSIFMSGSVAGYIILIPIFLGSITLCVPKIGIKRIYLIGVTIVLIGGIISDFLFFGGYLGELFSEFTDKGPASRYVMFDRTIEAAREHFPMGSGPGSFRSVYQLYEPIGAYSIPHAHNDFVEFILEFGLAGAIIGGTFLLWWSSKVLGVVRSKYTSTLFSRCACVATFGILLHSLADYPLRTIGLSVFFAFCICLITINEDFLA